MVRQADGNVAVEMAIRLRRAGFNRAIAEGDAGAIAAVLAKQAVLVTGSDSMAITGRAEQVKVWKREFAAPERMVYVRKPERIAVSRVEPVALEMGRWEGSGGGLTAGGEYTAKWREVGGEWMIEAEVFATLA
jgi:ketosteroid isomerase-like protein